MAWRLTMVAMMLVAGLAISACASGGSASTPSCSAYRTALSVVLAVPKPGKSLDQRPWPSCPHAFVRA